MNTSSLPPLVILGAVAVTSSADARAQAPAELMDGGHVRIVSAYLTTDADRTQVRGIVRRDPLWRGPTEGHLHVVAFANDGQPVARAVTDWEGRLTRHGGPAPYHVVLKVSRADVARLSVSWAPAAHKASEAFE